MTREQSEALRTKVFLFSLPFFFFQKEKRKERPT
jgi:hypothetical protein